MYYITEHEWSKLALTHLLRLFGAKSAHDISRHSIEREQKMTKVWKNASNQMMNMWENANNKMVNMWESASNKMMNMWENEILDLSINQEVEISQKSVRDLRNLWRWFNS